MKPLLILLCLSRQDPHSIAAQFSAEIPTSLSAAVVTGSPLCLLLLKILVVPHGLCTACCVGNQVRLVMPGCACPPNCMVEGYGPLSLFPDKSCRPRACQVDLRSDLWSTPWEVSSLPPGAQGTREPDPSWPFLTNYLALLPRASQQGGNLLSPDIAPNSSRVIVFVSTQDTLLWASSREWHGFEKLSHGPEMTIKKTTQSAMLTFSTAKYLRVEGQCFFFFLFSSYLRR